jgi:hypothetical protein
MASSNAPARPAFGAIQRSATKVQRACACGARASGDCESCKKKVQRKPRAQGAGATMSYSADAALTNGGFPLPSPLRTSLEPLYGADLSSVRLHDDASSHRATRDVEAYAFTLGSHVHFGPGQYRPNDSSGMRLLAHELAHTVQQSGAAISGAATVDVDPPHSPHEHEADRVADHVVGQLRSTPQHDAANGPTPLRNAPAAVSRATRPVVQRWQLLARLFGEGTFSDKELNDYLQYLDDHARIEGDYDSDNKARAIIRRWDKDRSAFDLTLPRRQLLLLELIDGPTLDDDEAAILTLLRNANDLELGTLVATAGGEESLKDEFHWAESDQLDALLAAWHARSRGGRAPSAKAFVTEVEVNQATPQTVVAKYSDGHSEGDICSTGKGTCCVEPGSDTGPTIGQTQQNDSNWTPVGPHTVYKKQETHGAIKWWMEFNTRAIALHQYSPVDGTPLSHGCVRLNASFAERLYAGVRERVTRVIVKNVPRPRCDHGPLQTEWKHDFSGASVDDGEKVSKETRELINHMRMALGAKQYKERLAAGTIPRCASPSGRPGGKGGRR